MESYILLKKYQIKDDFCHKKSTGLSRWISLICSGFGHFPNESLYPFTYLKYFSISLFIFWRFCLVSIKFTIKMILSRISYKTTICFVTPHFLKSGSNVIPVYRV